MPDSPSDTPLTGGCSCSYVRYKVNAAPFVIHCCHCHECQRLTGSAFVINYLVESSHIVLENEAQRPVSVRTPSTSGYGQLIQRCPKCQVALWSYYGGSGPLVAFLRTGTLDLQFQGKIVPDVHIFTKTKVPWLRLPEDKPSFEEFYSYDEYWSKESLERRRAIQPAVKKWREKQEKFCDGQAETLDEAAVTKMLADVKL
ncbi:uncharacterized protein PV09_00710 [Verruconis gallopava]|uniref:CENP-V/GFA domain-containing protein n=1 Tax=Verruconis gallopava TaxID=253628 RepID=A0A0D1Z733_9PEZI|nr:uncharacterized protein PV09_00710 [Verruconis gallopava]KIW08772.1 hypothetical protein PV09_00710 [Verruconis gallopava]